MKGAVKQMKTKNTRQDIRDALRGFGITAGMMAVIAAALLLK